MVVKALFRKGEQIRFVPEEDVREFLIHKWKDTWVSSIDEGESATFRKMMNEIVRKAMFYDQHIAKSAKGPEGIARSAGNAGTAGKVMAP